ncbi:MAG: redoxin domain-containing protein [Acidobacteria bacterium]|nr:redoxin domain-containing protein [Acidobacteriota bacterium]
MPLAVGDRAPEFTLKGHQSSDPVSLSDFRDKENVLLLFFPLAFSSVCTSELCSLRDHHTDYRKLDARILGISVDSPFTLAAWAQAEGFPFDLLSDFNREVSPRYDSLYDDLMGLRGVSKRSAFVIDKDGIVRYAEVCPSAGQLPDFEAIRNTLKTLA